MTFDLNHFFSALLYIIPSILLGIGTTLIVVLYKKCEFLQEKIEEINFVSYERSEEIQRLISIMNSLEEDLENIYGKISHLCIHNQPSLDYSEKMDRNLPLSVFNQIHAKKESPRRGRPPRATPNNAI